MVQFFFELVNMPADHVKRLC